MAVPTTGVGKYFISVFYGLKNANNKQILYHLKIKEFKLKNHI